jgi:hypothetical protein
MMKVQGGSENDGNWVVFGQTLYIGTVSHFHIFVHKKFSLFYHKTKDLILCS